MCKSQPHVKTQKKYFCDLNMGLGFLYQLLQCFKLRSHE